MKIIEVTMTHNIYWYLKLLYYLLCYQAVLFGAYWIADDLWGDHGLWDFLGFHFGVYLGAAFVIPAVVNLLNLKFGERSPIVRYAVIAINLFCIIFIIFKWGEITWDWKDIVFAVFIVDVTILSVIYAMSLKSRIEKEITGN